VNVNEAVKKRKSARAFTEEPVDDAQLRGLLELAARAPSGGNVQPWRVYVVNGERRDDLMDFLDGRDMDTPEYEVYPPSLWDPYRTNRFELGEQMYATMDIPREDKGARLAHMARNFSFFDAPCGFFCFIDRRMGAAQWSDLGMFLQTFMLLAAEAGLDTCPQEAWANYGSSVAEFVGAPENEMMFCGMAIGTADQDRPVNSLESERMALDDWCTWV
jgi:nitroreductase